MLVYKKKHGTAAPCYVSQPTRGRTGDRGAQRISTTEKNCVVVTTKRNSSTVMGISTYHSTQVKVRPCDYRLKHHCWLKGLHYKKVDGILA